MHPGDPGTVCSRRKQWGREVISGYSLTGEKCTVREPGQPGSKAVCTGLLQFASRCESSSLYPLCLLLMYGSRRLRRATSRCSAPKYECVTSAAAHMEMISDKLLSTELDCNACESRERHLLSSSKGELKFSCWINSISTQDLNESQWC